MTKRHICVVSSDLRRSRIQAKNYRTRLREIAEILEGVDRRCEAADGPVARIQEEITDEEMRKIYLLARRKRKL